MYADLDALEHSFVAEATLFMPFDELPKRIEGTTAIRDVFAPYFEDLRASDRKPPYFSLEARDLSLQRLSEDIAIVTFHLGELAQAGGSDPVRFSRRTFVVKRGVEGWRIAHLHASNMTLSPRGGS
jgi:hypothetical protein